MYLSLYIYFLIYSNENPIQSKKPKTEWKLEQVIALMFPTCSSSVLAAIL